MKKEQESAHIIHAYNVQVFLVDLFAEHPNHKLTSKEFMDINKETWRKVKRDLKLDI